MSAHQYGQITSDHLSCSCGWEDDGYWASTAEAISGLMDHAYQSGVLEAEARHAATLDAISDEPADWAAIAETVATTPALLMPVIVRGDPNDRTTWTGIDGKPISLTFDPGNSGFLVLPPSIADHYDGAPEELLTEIAEAMAKPLPHSRACGIRDHDHGVMCHSNCPTCGGKPVRR